MEDNQFIDVGTVVRTSKWGHEDTGTVVRREGDTVVVVWHSLFYVEDAMPISEVEVWADAPPQFRDWRGGWNPATHHDPREPIVVWLDRSVPQSSEPIAAVWLTFDRPDTFTFHSPTHSEGVESLEAACDAADRWSIKTGMLMNGPLFESDLHGYMRGAVDRAIKREARRDRRPTPPHDGWGYER